MDLNRAIILAVQAHTGQVDKGGNPYILHPLRVMLKMPDEKTRIVAVLHDVLEDTPLTLEDLRKEGFSEDILEALDHLTRREGESYKKFIRRAKQHPISRLVKLEDIEDNSDLSRIPNPSEEDFKRLERYKWAKKELLSLS